MFTKFFLVPTTESLEPAVDYWVSLLSTADCSSLPADNIPQGPSSSNTCTDPGSASQEALPQPAQCPAAHTRWDRSQCMQAPPCNTDSHNRGSHSSRNPDSRPATTMLPVRLPKGRNCHASRNSSIRRANRCRPANRRRRASRRHHSNHHRLRASRHHRRSNHHRHPCGLRRRVVPQPFLLSRGIQPRRKL